MMMYRIAASLLLIQTFVLSTAGENVTIVTEPNTGLTWSWTASGKSPIPWTPLTSPTRYVVCDKDQTDAWLRSNVFQVNDAKRVDVTVRYAVNNCSYLKTNYGFIKCKETFDLHVYKTAIKHDHFGSKAPEPFARPELYDMFGTTNPKISTVGTLAKPENTETLSFITDITTPYYYLAIHYTGGCFALYGVTISYSVCPSLAFPSSLVKLPQTTSPANGSIQVPGSCPAHSKPNMVNGTIYGHCKADGEWSTTMYSGECWCDAGYGKYSVGSGAQCQECPPKTFQNKPSNSECKDCPMNSKEDIDRRKCKCQSGFYRTEKESIYNNCTAQPSAPRGLVTTFFGATFLNISWLPPLDLGGRSDVYYEVECNQCNEKGQDCTKDCTGAVIIHASPTRMAAVQHLYAYTYYQIKVLAKNGVTGVAEKNKEESKYAILLERTKESVPGTPILQLKVLSPTSVLLTWTLNKTNAVVITCYQVAYYPMDEGSKKMFLNTTERFIAIGKLQPSIQYNFEVRAVTSIGMGPPSKSQVFNSQKSNNSNGSGNTKVDVVVPIVVTFICLDLVVIVVVIAVKVTRTRRLNEQNSNNVNNADSIPENTFSKRNVAFKGMCLDELPNKTEDLYALVTDDMLWEVPRENLSVIKRLGSGNFGYVDKALAIGIPGYPGQVTVAVKTLKENAKDHDKDDFLTELLLMKKLESHPRVVKLLGCCTDSVGPMSIILEYLPYGDLLGYLRRSRGHEDTYCSGDRRPEESLSSRDLLQFAWMISDGMKFLAENKCVHRDLAARNVLVGEKKLCKISDLGLARKVREDVYTRSREARLPIKWMPPESLFFGTSSIASDVWSYGIVLWEIFTLGDSPYPKYKGQDIPRLLQKGYRMPKPDHLSENLYSLMLSCWQEKPEDRPSFSSICDDISAFNTATMDYINLDVFDDAQYVNFDE